MNRALHFELASAIRRFDDSVKAHRALTLALLAAPLAAVAPPAFAQAGPAAEAPAACGHALSGPVAAKWADMGGQSGPLGCPLRNESATAPSPSGAAAREADFATGMILWHASGPRAGQAYAVTGCFWRLYFQYGGPSGWLGLPISDPENFPDGQRQAFEGGRITDFRSGDDCQAERTAEVTSETPAPVAPGGTSPLDAWFDAARGDHLSVASTGVARTAQGANYQRVGSQAQVFEAPGTGTAPLKLFWNEAKGDHLATATAEGEREAFAAGYAFEASEGYVWADPHPGAHPLAQYVDPASGHHWLVASQAEADEAKAKGFVFLRVEGYAPAS